MADNKRLLMLEKMTSSGQADSFAWYALAMEYRNAGQQASAITTFEKLREQDPDYLPQYLMAGQMLIQLDRKAEAQSWLTRGVELARSVGDDKALSELTAALDEAQA